MNDYWEDANECEAAAFDSDLEDVERLVNAVLSTGYRISAALRELWIP